MQQLAPPLWELSGRPPHAVAIEDVWRSLSWREVDERSAAMVHMLEKEGLAPGDHLVIAGGNRVEYLDIALGCMRGGFVFTPVKTSWTADEVGYVLDDAGSRAVATDVPAAKDAAARVGIPVV